MTSPNDDTKPKRNAQDTLADVLAIGEKLHDEQWSKMSTEQRAAAVRALARQFDEIGGQLEKIAKQRGTWTGVLPLYDGEATYAAIDGRLVHTGVVGGPAWAEDPETLPEQVMFWERPEQMSGGATPAARTAIARRRAIIEAGEKALGISAPDQP
ncbi:Hypothetical protein AJAP_42690 (plasmid) [Amycolatopsis japonica]|uniref:Uncharacterized protein n=1 Tax=Amycolatopsis japonica TaxID=208439 RepID=A0A075VEG4_9PSEU|nr:hypothetical protein [Amycolatopsis japonica]AIG81305.1 Hypothetical protein AJAP_42690 [Amycolatopsis japonica]